MPTNKSQSAPSATAAIVKGVTRQSQQKTPAAKAFIGKGPGGKAPARAKSRSKK